ncbi:MAG: S-layer homology domain-containing protein [Chloroflexia bacterium]
MKRALFFVCLAICVLGGLGVASAAYSAPGGPAASLQSTGPASATGMGARLAGASPTATPCSIYSCATTPGATVVPGTADIGNHCDDCVTHVTLPFSVQLYGISYAGVNVGSNGTAQFVSTDAEFTNICLPITAMGPTIFAYWEDLVTEGTNCAGGAGCGIYASVSGSAPNRIFNIEWRTFYFSEPGNAYFELRLYEGSSNFEVILGAVNIEATATIGVQDGAGRFTQCLCSTAPTANSRITFNAGSGTCPTPVPTATVTTPTATRTPSGPTATPTLMATRTNTAVATPGVTNTATPVTTATNTPERPPSPPPTVPPIYTPTPTATQCPMSFTDVPPTDPFYTAICYLYCGGVISGYADNTFRPGNPATRGQLTKIVTLAEGWPLYSHPQPTFRDVPATQTFYTYIETAYQRGIISGYTCGSGCLEFRPDNNVTRAQLTKIVVNAREWAIYTPPQPSFRDVGTTDPFYRYIETAYYHGIISGYNCGPGCLEFKPGNSATRGQISKIVYLAVTEP